SNYDFTNEPNRRQERFQCYKKLFIPGTSLYMFTGPKEASKEFNLTFERKKVIVVKRKNRVIVNQKELEEFLEGKFGKENIEAVYLEELSFVQQIEKMSKAKLLI
ncbi:unnamed protein product, partial [Brachionus calyciflorus]